MKVLIVEDNPMNMKLVTALLGTRSHVEVIEACDAETGISLAREHQPPLILMDIHMPGMDGLTATRLLKADEKTRHIKIVAITALAMKGDEQRMLEAGCDHYISKPLRYQELLQIVDKYLPAGDPAEEAT